MRQIIIDTETTGLEPTQGHRIVEIGCIELIDRKKTDNNFHCYINPQREMDAEVIAVHGLTTEFLQDKPVFAAILDDFLKFIDQAELIAHNATFDIGFLNHEIRLINKDAKLIDAYAANIVNTLPLARKMFPGQRNSLDALCRRYKIDLSGRKLHGALLDAQLLAEVYLLMTGGQVSLFDIDELNSAQSTDKKISKKISSNRSALPIIYANAEESTEHEKMLTKINNK